MKRKAAPSTLVAALLAEGGRARRGWEFPAEALADIAEARRVNDAGEGWISAARLARALKQRYNLPASTGSIRDRLAAMHGGRW